MEQPLSAVQPLAPLPATSLSSLAQRARSRRTHSMPYHAALLLPHSNAFTASDSPGRVPASNSLFSASAASDFQLPAFTLSLPLNGKAKRFSLTQPPSPTWQSFLPKSNSVAHYAADDATITRSSISSSLSSLQLPRSVHSIDIPESPLLPAEREEAAGLDAFRLQVDEAATAVAATDGAQPSSRQHFRPPPTRRSPRAWLLLWLVTQPRVMMAVTCGLIVYHSLLLYAAMYVGYLVFFPSAPIAAPYQLCVILLMFSLIGRSLFQLLHSFARVRFRHMWANQRRHRQLLSKRLLHAINLLLTSAVVLASLPTLVTLFVSAHRAWSDPLIYIVAAMVAMEAGLWLATGVALGLLRRDFSWKELSLHVPFVPISATFNSTALQRRTVEQHRRVIDALPVHKFDLAQWREQQQRQQATRGHSHSGSDSGGAVEEEEEGVCCAICLVDMADGDSMRALKCSHCFHRACIDTVSPQLTQHSILRRAQSLVALRADQSCACCLRCSGCSGWSARRAVRCASDRSTAASRATRTSTGADFVSARREWRRCPRRRSSWPACEHSETRVAVAARGFFLLAGPAYLPVYIYLSARQAAWSLTCLPQCDCLGASLSWTVITTPTLDICLTLRFLPKKRTRQSVNEQGHTMCRTKQLSYR